MTIHSQVQIDPMKVVSMAHRGIERIERIRQGEVDSLRARFIMEKMKRRFFPMTEKEAVAAWDNHFDKQRRGRKDWVGLLYSTPESRACFAKSRSYDRLIDLLQAAHGPVEGMYLSIEDMNLLLDMAGK